MKSAALSIDKTAPQTRVSGLFNDYPRQVFLKRLSKLQHGELILIDGQERHVFGRRDEVFPNTVVVTIRDPSFYTRLLMHGALGGGQSYIQGHWECEDLTGMVELFLCNRHYIEKTGPLSKWLLIKPYHLLQRYLSSQHPERQPPQYRGALRYRQRPVRAVSRPRP